MYEDYIYYDKEQALELVKKYGYLLQYLNAKLKDDYDVVLAALKENASVLQYASDRLKDNKELVLFAVQKYGNALEWASARLQNDKDVVMLAIKSDGFALQYASNDLKNDKDIVLTAVASNKFSYSDFGKKIRKDRDVCLAAFTSDFSLAPAMYDLECDIDENFLCDAMCLNGMKLKKVGQTWQRNKKVVISAIKQNPNALQFANKRLRENPDIIEYITNPNKEMAEEIKETKKQDSKKNVNKREELSKVTETEQKEIVDIKIQNEESIEIPNEDSNNDIEEVIAKLEEGFAYTDLAERYKENKEIALRALKLDKDNIKFVSENLKNDKDIALQAILDGHSLNFKYIPNDLKNDREFVLTVLSYYQSIDKDYEASNIYPYISDALKKDREITMISVKASSICYKYVPPEFKNDSEIVSSFANNHSLYFNEAPQEFKNDRNFVLNTINNEQNQGNLYDFIKNISPELKDDEEIMLAAMKKSSVFYFCSDRLKNDKDFILKVLNADLKNNMYEVAKNIGPKLRDDKDFILIAMPKSSSFYDFCSDRLKKDKELAMIAVKYSGLSYKNMPDEFKKDPEIIFELARHDIFGFEYAPLEFKNNKEFILKVINDEQNKRLNYFIKNISHELQDDEEIMLAALKKDANVYKLCSDRLKNDKDFLLAVVKENQKLYDELPLNLKDDVDIKEAYKQEEII